MGESCAAEFRRRAVELVRSGRPVVKRARTISERRAGIVAGALIPSL
jgi:hypothetical protein